ncbi:Virulence-associated protein E (fragment) [Candidatus Desulfosporosinus infrequens]|uniref:Virulence-associated protein E n=1 Tax=Candidatus Desulfosporosinus infrequens TaxID=2043169 RepID=A0A2U3L6R3_9FIRM
MLLIDYLGAADIDYVRSVTRKVFTAAVARVFEPGVKFDWMLVLNGPGGIGKSTLINKLAGQWFSDSLQLSDTHDKTGAEKLQGFWIMEIGELSGMKRTEQDALKQFLSSQNDIYRASFGRRATPHLRQCIFIGTTNSERGYLRDTTGNRRFWPVKVDASDKKPWSITDEDISQTWAEAKVRYHAGETLQLPEELEKYAEQMQNEAMEVDDREGVIEAYLNKLLPNDWESKNEYARRDYLSSYYDNDSIFPKGNNPRTTVSAQEIWCEAFGKDKGNIRRTDSLEICVMLRRIKGWESKGKLQTTPLYGRQKIFEKVNSERTEPIIYKL